MEKQPEKYAENQIFKACTAILLKEIELLGKIPPLQILIRDALLNREWADYECLMESIGRVGADFELLEAERVVVFAKFAQSEDEDEKQRFYAIAAKLPEEQRNELTALYRRLKMETLQIRLANDTLLDYLKETRTVISGILENAYPDRKGKIYSRTGTEREADMKSIVLNRSF
jgi:hypothetical protein